MYLQQSTNSSGAVAKERNKVAETAVKKLEINLSENLTPDSSLRKNLGYAVPKAIYESLGLYDFFQYKQRFINAEFNLNSIFSLLIYNRFLFPSSIKHAYETRDLYFNSFDFELEDCYRALDFYENYSQDIQKLLSTKTKEMFGRDLTLDTGM